MPDQIVDGRSPSEWIGELETASGPREEEAREALRAGGDAAFDQVRRALEYHEPALRRRFREAAIWVPGRFRPVLVDHDRRRLAAARWAAWAMPGSANLAEAMTTALIRAQKEDVAQQIGLALMRFGHDVLPHLTAGAHGQGAPSRARALFWLGELATSLDPTGPEREMIEAWARSQLGAMESRVRGEAAAVVGKLGPSSTGSIPLLVEALQDSEAAVRGAAAVSLGQVRGPAERCAAPLAVLLSDPEPEVRVAAAMALGQLGAGARPTAAALANAATSSHLRLAVVASQSLGRIGAPGAIAVPALTSNLHRPEPLLRWASATALGRLAAGCDAELVPHLARALSDPDVYVRRGAAQALAAFGGRAAPALATLIAVLRDQDESVRVAAAEALGALGPLATEAVPALLAARNNNQSVMSVPVIAALERIQLRPEQTGGIAPIPALD